MKKNIFMLAFLFSVAFLSGCSFDSNSLTEEQHRINNYVRELKRNNANAERYADSLSEGKQSEEVSEQEAIQNGIDTNTPDGYYASYYKNHTEVSTEEITSWGANDNITHPGSLLNISDYNRGETLAPIIGLDRAPITLSISLEGSGVSKLSKKVNNPTYSGVREGIGDLVKKIDEENADLPARLYSKFTEVNSNQELSFALGGSLNFSHFSQISADFNFRSKTKKTYAVLLIKQIYYTIDVDYDYSKGASGFFKDTTSDVIKSEIPSYSAPVYVSSVSYGRVVAIAIKSDLTMQEIKSSISVGTSHFSMDTEISFNNNYNKMDISYFLYGGSSDNSKIIGMTNLNDMLDEINKKSDPKDMIGLPISYRLSNLGDGSLARVGSASDYYSKDLNRIGSFSTILRDGTNVKVSDKGYTETVNYNIDDEKMLNLGYKNYCIQLEFDMREEEDGYQHIEIIAGNNSYGHRQYEHGGNKRDTTWKTYDYQVTIPINSFSNNQFKIHYWETGLTIWGGMNDWFVGKTIVYMFAVK